MGALSALKRGIFGIQFNIPAAWQMAKDEETHLELADTEKGVQWHFFFFPDLHMDISKAAQPYLAASLPAYARLMFEQVFPVLNADNPKAEPRTKDPAWSPLVDVEYVTVGGAPALRTIHRMAYQPGREIHLGHVLVPLKRGLFEARVVTTDSFTGGRECVVMLKTDRDAGAGETTIPPQAQMDDPKYDASFPEHCLSRARAALQWFTLESGALVRGAGCQPSAA
ncbi:MAG: hypothetical protein IPK82_19320 [Polyangiaceae bacterium]|nr:hypothetical protein [Polyangiaceae bacterium]